MPAGLIVKDELRSVGNFLSAGTGSGVVSFTSVQLKKYESLVSVYARIKLNDTSPHCNLTLWTTVGSGNELQLKQVAREGNGWFTFDLQQAVVCSGGQEPLVSVGDVRAEATWIDQERRSASGSNPQVVKSIVLVYMQTNQSMDSGYPIPKMKDSTTSIAAAKQAAALTAVKRSPANSISPCRVVKYFVTYEEVDLGLGDIIFPPNGFDLNFCAGDCNSHEITPTSKLLYNHSIYQREAHTLHKDVPGIACVPHTLNPRTFVYHDPQDSEMVAMTQMLYVKIPKDGCTCL